MFRPLGLVLLCSVLFACAQPDDASRLDLSGEWKLELLECLPGEANCLEQMPLHEATSVRAPLNLRPRLPWFYGRALLSRTFQVPAHLINTPLVLNLGAVGSVDRVSINGVFIGTTGDAGDWREGRLSSAWNRPRSYHLPSNLLRETNRIQIEFWMFDDRAGLHRGPVALSSDRSDLASLHWRYEYLPVGILILFVFNSIFQLILLGARLLAPGYSFLLLASIAYVPFCAYYLSSLPSLPYLTFLQWSLTGGFMTAVFNFQLFLRVFDQPRARWERIASVSLMVLALAHFAMPDFFALALLARVFHFLVVALLLGALVILLRLQKRNPGLKNIGFFLIPAVGGATLLNLHDLIARLHWIDSEPLFNYSAYLYVLTMNGLQAFQLMDVNRRVNEYRTRLRDERDRIARDLHDVVGSELTGIIYEFESRPSNDPPPGVGHRLRGTLERLRDLVYIFHRPEEEALDLEAEIRSYARRLEKTGRFRIRLDLGSGLALTPLQALQMQRIFAEWMTNVLRHGKPNSISIELRIRHNGRVVLRVANNGLPFAWDGRAGKDDGHGISNMARRSESIDGRIRVFERPGGGALFVLRIHQGTNG